MRELLTTDSLAGQQVSHYRLVRRIGAGSMGVVYLARDESLDRDVAVKFLAPGAAKDPISNSRFIREAKSASALDHPNVATVHEIGEWHGQLFIAMAYYDGETLKERIDRGGLSVDEIVSLTGQIAAGLAAAHSKHIVHRDLKPANIAITQEGTVKILDFGLAKINPADQETAILGTQVGTTLGTAPYMSPEQVRGEDVDARADVWALGVVVYQMLTGRLPFRGDNSLAMMHAIATETPTPALTLRPDAPRELAEIVQAALQKDLDERTVTAADFASAAANYRHRTATPTPAQSAATFYSRTKMTAVVIVMIAVASLGFVWWTRATRLQWAREIAPLEVQKLADSEQFVAAFDEAVRAESIIPQHPGLVNLWPIISRRGDIKSTPPGAEVSFRNYGEHDAPWRRLGRTPLAQVRYPRGFFEWKLQLSGYAEVQDVGPAPFWPINATYVFERAADKPEGMVRVSPGGEPFQIFYPGLDHLPAVRLDDYWIDQHEVTNKEYKRFVDEGGYRRHEFWPQEFIGTDGRLLSTRAALQQFLDATGRPGPATWESGSYPAGQDDFPVTGVSWYEAVAYATFVDKQLPTVFHWSMVADQRTSGSVEPASNFSGKGLLAVGTSKAWNRFGAVDMAGNAKEWVANSAGKGRRYILGGSWNEPTYMFTDGDARSAFTREATFGFRCMKPVGSKAVAADLLAEIAYPLRDYAAERPAGDRIVSHYLSFYAYDRGALDARVESADESTPEWRLEKVSFSAAYGQERVTAYLFLPKSGPPPYQAVVLFPGSNVINTRASSQLEVRASLVRFFDFLLKTRRAVVWPIYKGTYERGGGITSDYPNMSVNWRDHIVMIAKDLERTMDYLSSRPDISMDKIGYMGVSWGAAMGAMLPAIETRLRAAVLIVGGFYQQRSLPEADAFNFTPRVKIPTLMLNGKYDFFYPTQSSQEPMFALLGTPVADKKRIVYDTGHSIPRNDMIKETLDWFDKYLGPVGLNASTTDR